MEYMIDSEMLILAIEKRPLLWDQNHEYYKHRARKREAWIEICEMIFDDLDTKEEAEKVYISKQVETKWRHIRDNFTRDLREKSRRSSTPRGKMKRKYIYAEQLEFLRNHIEQRFKVDEEAPERGGDAAEECDSDEPIEALARRRPRASRPPPPPPFEESLFPMEQPRAEESDDLAFFRSLTPMLATLTTQQKMQFRIDVMQQLMKYHSVAPAAAAAAAAATTASSSALKFDYE